jgi:hypothetical protein
MNSVETEMMRCKAPKGRGCFDALVILVRGIDLVEIVFFLMERRDYWLATIALEDKFLKRFLRTFHPKRAQQNEVVVFASYTFCQAAGSTGFRITAVLHRSFNSTGSCPIAWQNSSTALRAAGKP